MLSDAPLFSTQVMSIAIFVYWVLDVPATFITGFDRAGILEMRMRNIAQNYAKGQGPFLVRLVRLKPQKCVRLAFA